MGPGEAQAAEQAVVQHALARGWLSQEQLRAALLLQHRLAGEGRPTALLPILRRVLPPAHLPELTRVWQASQTRASSRLGTGARAALPTAAEVPERLLHESSELLRRPPEQDPEPVRRFMEESRRGGALIDSRGQAGSDRIGPPAAATEVAHLPGPGPDGEKVPTRLGGYRVLRELARGGMGIVYEAHALGLDRRVALKVLRYQDDADDLRRFVLEARAVARLRHPAIVGVHEVGEDAGVHFIAMDYVQGRSLKARIRAEGPLPPEDAARIALRVAEGLEHAHEQGILHRDVKPHNVLLDETRGGEAVLGDFGLAKRVDHSEGMTATGTPMGTPAYMAPEQVTADAVDPRTDVWGLGATLYEMLAGRPPFQAATPVGMAQAVLRETPAPPSRWRGGIPPDLETVCLKCLEKPPQRRYASAGELARDLQRFLHDEPVTARRAGPLQRLRRALRRHRAVLIGSTVALSLAAGLVLVRERSQRAAAAAAAAARRAEVEQLLERVRAQGFENDEARTAAVFQLARLADGTVEERLAQELAQAALELRAAELACYQEVREPTPEERARGEVALEGLEEALAARLPGEALPRAQPHRGRIEAAWKRLEEQARRVATRRDMAGQVPPKALELVARRQSAQLGKRADVARLCCEVLTRVEGHERARAALILYLGAEADPVRAAAAAVALVHTGGEEALRPVLASLDRFGEQSPFAGPVKRALAHDAARAQVPRPEDGDLRSLLVRGELREVSHEWTAAREAYDAALAQAPLSAEAWRRRGLVRMQLHDLDGAKADCDHALELAPQEALGWVARAQVRQEQGDLDGALADAGRAVELAPEDARAWRTRAYVRSMRKDRQGAQADASRALELDPRDARSWLLRGQTRHDNKDPGGLADLDRAIELDPGLPLAWRARAGVRFERQDLAGALADYARALELDPTHVSTWVNRGSVRTQLGDHAGAQDDLTHAIELDAALWEAWDNRARSRLLQGDLPGAASDAERAIALRPNQARPWCTLGVAHLQLGRLREALTELDRAVELAPDEADVWSNRAAAHARADDLAGARRDLDRAVALAPNVATYWINRGRVRRDQGDPRGALEDLSRAIGLDPNSAQAWEDRSEVRLQAGDVPGALEDIRRAVNLDLGNAKLYFQLAMLQVRCGQHSQALASLDEAILRDQRLASAWGLRAGLRLALGQTEEALGDYTRFLELDPDHPEAPAVRALLAEHGRHPPPPPGPPGK